MLRDCHCERSLRSNLLVTRGLLRAQTARPRNDSRVWLRLCRARFYALRMGKGGDYPRAFGITKKAGPPNQYVWRVGLQLQFAQSNYVSFIFINNNVRQGETPQSERLARGRLVTICLEFRLPNDVMEYVLLFPDCLYDTTI